MFKGWKNQVVFGLFALIMLSCVILGLIAPLLIVSLLAFLVWEGKIKRSKTVKRSWTGAAVLLAIIAFLQGIFAGTFASGLGSILVFAIGIIIPNTIALLIALSEQEQDSVEDHDA